MLKSQVSHMARRKIKGPDRFFFYSRKIGKVLYLANDMEVRFAEKLEKSPNVLLYDYESIEIPYSYEGNTHITKPDFPVILLGNIRKLYELKKHLRADKKTIAKSEGIRQWGQAHGWEFELVTEESMRELLL